MTTVATRRPAGTLPRVAAYLELTKPGIVSFVLVVTAVAYTVGSPGPVVFAGLLHALAGTGLATAGALVLNQYLERDADAVMVRTRGRPLPSERLLPAEALAFGSLLVPAGVLYLTLAGGAAAGALTAVSAVTYLGVYTPLKRRSAVCTLVGAVPGALPALIGWSAAAGAPSHGAWVLFAIVYLWQIPHVLAIAWLAREDFRRAGFHMIPLADPEGRSTARHMVMHTAALLPVSLLPVLGGFAGTGYFAGALLLGLAYLGGAAHGLRGLTDRRARVVFFLSLLYLPSLLTLLVLSPGAA